MGAIAVRSRAGRRTHRGVCVSAGGELALALGFGTGRLRSGLLRLAGAGYKPTGVMLSSVPLMWRGVWTIERSTGLRTFAGRDREMTKAGAIPSTVATRTPQGHSADVLSSDYRCRQDASTGEGLPDDPSDDSTRRHAHDDPEPRTLDLATAGRSPDGRTTESAAMVSNVRVSARPEKFGRGCPVLLGDLVDAFGSPSVVVEITRPRTAK